MKKLEVVFAIALGLALAVVLIWGVAKATKDLTALVAGGISNISAQAE